MATRKVLTNLKNWSCSYFLQMLVSQRRRFVLSLLFGSLLCLIPYCSNSVHRAKLKVPSCSCFRSLIAHVLPFFNRHPELWWTFTSNVFCLAVQYSTPDVFGATGNDREFTDAGGNVEQIVFFSNENFL